MIKRQAQLKIEVKKEEEKTRTHIIGERCYTEGTNV